MAQNHIQVGSVMSWTNDTGSAVSSGDPVAINDRIAVALDDISADDSGDVAVDEVFELPKEAALAISQGEAVYLDSSAGEIGTTDTNTPAGYCFEDAADSDSTVKVKING